MSECVCVCARAFLAVIELLFGSVLKVGFYIMKWNVIYKCVCVCVRARACVLNFYFAYLSLRHRTIFYIRTLLLLTACVCVRVCVRACMCARAGVSICIWVLFC